jgi:hypothetical protein
VVRHAGNKVQHSSGKPNWQWMLLLLPSRRQLQDALLCMLHSRQAYARLLLLQLLFLML